MAARHLRTWLLWLCAFVTGAALLYAYFAKTQKIAASDAGSHVGEVANVCGLVTTLDIPRVKGDQTVLYFKADPDHPFAAIIPFSDFPRFERENINPFRYLGNACVKGRIKPGPLAREFSIVVHFPGQIVHTPRLHSR